VARAALREDVVLAPGDVFSLAQTASDFRRFNLAQLADPPIIAVLAQALAAGSA
jgi:DNA-binding transcriptional MocR family regulator